MSCHWPARAAFAGVGFLTAMPSALVGGNVKLRPAGTADGYVARLLVNEAPFPGERGWIAEEDSRAAMRQVLFVLDGRLRAVPPPYTQSQVASVRTNDIIDLITAGGVHGQVEGFYRDDSGRPVFVARVRERVDNLTALAEKGAPGRFARLLNYAQEIAAAWFAGKLSAPDLFRDLRRVEAEPVTGRAYSWMTDLGTFHPGGNFVRITDDLNGSLGGNRFFTLRRVNP